jgi:hypothetical protein
MQEKTLKEIEEEMDCNAKQGNIGKVMDLVDEHGNTFDRMHYAIEEGNIERVIELEKLGLNITDRAFLQTAIKHGKNIIVFHQAKKGANLDDVIELAKEHHRDFILQWAKFARRNKMGNS